MTVITTADAVSNYINAINVDNFIEVPGGHRRIFIPKPQNKVQRVIKLLPVSKDREISIWQLRRIYSLANELFNINNNSSFGISYVHSSIDFINIGDKKYLVFEEDFLPKIYGKNSESIRTQNLCSLYGLFPDKNSNELTPQCKKLLKMSFDDSGITEIVDFLAKNGFKSMVLTLTQISTIPQFKETMKWFLAGYQKFFDCTEIFLDSQGSRNFTLHVDNKNSKLKVVINNSSVKYYSNLKYYLERVLHNNNFAASPNMTISLVWANLLAKACQVEPIFGLDTGLLSTNKDAIISILQ